MMKRQPVLVVDDDADFRRLVALALPGDAYEVIEAADGEAALAVLAARTVPAALVDLGLPGPGGLDLLRRIAASDDPPACIVVTGSASVRDAVAAMRTGAFHYLTKPVDLDELEATVEKALASQRSDQENRRLRESLRRGGGRSADTEVVAASEALRAVFREARDLAQLDAPVLIEGETGVGKEVVASFIHRNSRRADGPFHAVNCGAIPDSLIDSEFFGHEKGAFTGAETMRPGLVEVADSGTLLLDEIGDIAEPAQVRLLRTLEQGVVRRVGGSREIPVDVRILAATHRNLEAQVRAGRFRADLFHRLVVLRLRIPPLRERRDDIVPLASFFLDQLCTKYGDEVRLSPDSHGLLVNYPWLGNVRELRNVVERAWFASLRDGSSSIRAHHLEFLAQPASGEHAALERRTPAAGQPAAGSGTGFFLRPDGQPLSLAEVEARHLRRVLAACQGNRRKAADLLGISERSLYRKLQELDAAAEAGTVPA